MKIDTEVITEEYLMKVPIIYNLSQLLTVLDNIEGILIHKQKCVCVCVCVLMWEMCM